jgi:hypothetical protein
MPWIRLSSPTCFSSMAAARARLPVRKWRKRGDIPAEAKPANVAKVMLAFFLGVIVQSAMIGGIDPGAVSKGFEKFDRPIALRQRIGAHLRGAVSRFRIRSAPT